MTLGDPVLASARVAVEANRSATFIECQCVPVRLGDIDGLDRRYRPDPMPSLADDSLDGVRAIAICPGFVDTAMSDWTGMAGEEMIRPEDCAEIVRMCLRLGPRARIPQVVIERLGSGDGDVHLSGA